MTHKFAGETRQTLHRYKPFDADKDLDPSALGYLASTIQNRIIYVPKVSQFNDPWEVTPSFDLPSGLSDAEIVDGLLHSKGVAPSTAGRTATEELLKSTGRMALLECIRLRFSAFSGSRCLLCLSSDATIPLLWSYYAGGHSGFVLEFDCTKQPLGGAVKVLYDEDYPVVNPCSRTLHEVAEEVLFQKADFWRHEREWRLIVPSGKSEAASRHGYDHVEWEGPDPKPPGVFLKLTEGTLKSITLGLRMDTTDIDKIVDAVTVHCPTVHVFTEAIGNHEFKVERRLHPRSPASTK